MYKEVSALDNLQWLICLKTKSNPFIEKSHLPIEAYACPSQKCFILLAFPILLRFRRHAKSSAETSSVQNSAGLFYLGSATGLRDGKL